MSNFKRIDTPIEGLYIIESKVFGDKRGFFMETYSRRDFQELGIDVDFVQDNHSKSSKGVLRGLHFQRQFPQGKLIRVVSGAVLDVVVDLRPESETCGRYFAVELSADNGQMLYVPPRFAHGFLTLEDETEFLYKCTEYYHPESDSGVLWCDLKLNIDWQLRKYAISENDLIISDKDKILPQCDEINIQTLWK